MITTIEVAIAIKTRRIVGTVMMATNGASVMDTANLIQENGEHY